MNSNPTHADLFPLSQTKPSSSFPILNLKQNSLPQDRRRPSSPAAIESTSPLQHHLQTPILPLFSSISQACDQKRRQQSHYRQFQEPIFSNSRKRTTISTRRWNQATKIAVAPMNQTANIAAKQNLAAAKAKSMIRRVDGRDGD
ncbi:unnamed protein product [Camellia sinensis]